MRKFLIFICTSFIFMKCSSITDEPVLESGVTNSVFMLDSEGNIATAQKALGKLYKVKKVYTDPVTGSSIEVVFGAVSKELLDDYFKVFDISFDGVSQEEVDQAKKLLKTGSSSRPQNSDAGAREEAQKNIDPDGVYYDLASKKLRGSDVGFVFSIQPKNIADNTSKFKARSFDYRQQTSLPWCELAVISKLYTPGSGSSGKMIWMREQTRGLIWTKRADWLIELNNNHVNAVDIDGPKFTRFGTESDYDRWGVAWWDAESDESIEIDFIPLP